MSEQLAHLARRMAWRRAVGELQSMLETFGVYDSHVPPPPKHLMDEEKAKFHKVEAAFSKFIKHVENEGLHE